MRKPTAWVLNMWLSRGWPFHGKGENEFIEAESILTCAAVKSGLWGSTGPATSVLVVDCTPQTPLCHECTCWVVLRAGYSPRLLNGGQVPTLSVGGCPRTAALALPGENQESGYVTRKPQLCLLRASQDTSPGDHGGGSQESWFTNPLSTSIEF